MTMRQLFSPSDMKNQRHATLVAFGWIMLIMFMMESAIMYGLSSLGLLDALMSTGISENLLDAFLLVLVSGPYIWLILRRQADALHREKIAENSRFLLQIAFENSSEAFVLTDVDARIIDVNPAFTAVTGYAREEVVGQNPRILRSGQHDAEFYRSLWRCILQDGKWQGEIWNRRKNGEIYPEWLTIRAIKDDQGHVSHFISIFTDITSRKRLEENLHQVAHFDALTGLPNRKTLYEKMMSSLARAEQDGTMVALIFFDLDRFKNVNETLGHKIGDELLQLVSKRLTAAVRKEDTISRLGGDEFIILVESIHHASEVSDIAKKILSRVSMPFKIHPQELHVTASLGISIFPEDGEDRTTLMKNADTALYRAIEFGGNNYQFYKQAMNAHSFERLTLENSLHFAVKRNELRVYYQPQVATRTGRIIGMEALVRWEHPEFGLVSPAMFIPLAEENGMIIEIGEWVFRTACQQAKAWTEAGFPLRVGVNVSARQFHQEDIRERILNVLKETALDPHQLEIEITESLVMSKPDEAIAILNNLRELGIHIAIDDFGTGYSSLSHLKHFPANTLKIDQSFIKDVTLDEDDAAITASMISLAHSLGIKSIAEGVETPEQLAFLHRNECHEIQGFLFSRPLPAADFEKLLYEGMILKPKSGPV